MTLITINLNNLHGLQKTVESVLHQTTTSFQYIVIDGGSTDGSVPYLHQTKSPNLKWISESDSGIYNAMNKGFARATGDILMWLNSDDMLMHNVLQLVANKYLENPNALYFGNCLHFRMVGDALSSYGSNVTSDFQNNQLSEIDFIKQPSSFWSREIWEDTGLLRNDLHFGFDWEWFLRVEQKYRLIPIIECISLYRLHDSHKSGIGGFKRQQELLEIYEIYNPKMAIIYKNLMGAGVKAIENYNTLKYSIKRIIGRDTSLFQKVRDFNNGEFKSYTDKEIANALRML